MSSRTSRRGKPSRWLAVAMTTLLGVALMQAAPAAAGSVASNPTRSAPAAGATGEASSTSVQNPGFEEALVGGRIPGWRYWSSGTQSGLSVSDANHFSGARSLRIDTTGTLGAESALLAVAPGQTYEAKVRLNVESVQGTPQLWIRWYDSQGKPLNKQATFTVTDPPLGRWLDIRTSGTAPVDASQASVFVYANSATALTAYVDDVEFTRVSHPNLLSNPGFEQSSAPGPIASWSRYPSETLPPTTSVSLTRDQQHSGLNSALITDDDSSLAVGLRSKSVAVTPKSGYTAGVSVRVGSGTTIIYLKFYNAANAEVGQSTKTVTGPVGEWTDVDVKGAAPAEASSARILLYAPSTTTGAAYVDDAFLTEDGSVSMPYEFGAPMDLGPAALSTKTLGGAMGNGEVYFVTNGEPGTFYALDAVTGEINFSQQVPGTTETWAVTVGSDGKAYFAGTKSRKFWQYDPDQKKVTMVGDNPSDNFVWDLDASSNGLIYGSTSSFDEDGKIFTYDTNTHQFTNLGAMYPGQNYVHGAGVTGRYLYAGIGGFKHLVRIDRSTGERIEIPLPVTGEEGFIHNVWVYAGLLYVRDGTGLIVMDEDTFEVKLHTRFTDERTFDGMISPPSPTDPQLLYYRNKVTSALWTYNVATNSVQAVTPEVTLPSSTAKAMGWVAMPDGHQVLGTLYESGEYTTYDPQSATLQDRSVTLARSGVTLNSIAAGPDGKLYLGGYIDGMSVFDEQTQRYENQVSSPTAPAQVENTGFLNGKAYFGTYPGARIYRYDAQKPYDYGASPAHNPGLAYTVPSLQDRPFAFASGDNKLFAGTVPAYSYEGGSLTVYDDTTGKWSSTRNVVENQSIVSLAYRDGILYGGTSTYGGLGIDNSTTTAHLFKWDAARGSKIGSEFVPQIPGMKTPELLGGLAFGPDGLLWGAAYGQLTEGGTGFALYAMNAETNEIAKSTLLYKGAARGNQWREFYLRWGPDGLLYTSVARYVTVVDPDTLSHRKLVNEPTHIMDIGKDGSLYYGNGSHLFKLQVPLSEASIAMSSTDLKEGDEAPVVSSGVLANGLPAIMAGATVSYSSSDPSVATVDDDGTLHALTRGAADVHADISLGGVTVRTNTITVRIYRSSSLTVDSLEAAYSDVATLRATLVDGHGSPLVDRTVHFAVDGKIAGVATTDVQGKAATAYHVTQGVPVGANSADVEIGASFERDEGDFTEASDGAAELTITRETAAVQLTDRTVQSAGSVALSARVSQQDDGGAGALDDLPVRFGIYRINTDGTVTQVDGPQPELRTDANGAVNSEVALPAGLYQVRAELLANTRYSPVRAASDLAVLGSVPRTVKVSGSIAIDEPNPVIGSRAKTLQVRADLDSRQLPSMSDLTLTMRAAPHGLSLSMESAEWLIMTADGTYLQGTATDEKGAVYTMRFMLAEHTRVVSLLIWQGNVAQGAPAYQVLGARLR